MRTDDRLVIVISGCHAGPNPSPGLGTARSLRCAYADSFLVAKDHSVHCTGIHEEVFDEVWVCRPWNEIDLECHYTQLRKELEPTRTFFISGLDLEVRWLAGRELHGALLPPLRAVERTAKPAIEAASGLPVRTPDWTPLSVSEREIHRFCRAHDWDIWVKGTAYEARRVRTWRELTKARRGLEKTWGSHELYLQAHISGWEVSVSFVALEGSLLQAVFMEKHFVTPEGKTWSGEVERCPEALGDPLRDVVRDLRWTGGGELEFVRDTQGELWLIDWNPRFPAWIHGATLAGWNLPAALIAAASGRQPKACEQVSEQFVRVVIEVPVREGFPLPPPPPRSTEASPVGKHPSGMPLLMRRLLGPAKERDGSEFQPRRPVGDELLVDDLLDQCTKVEKTPRRLFLPRVAARTFREVRKLLSRWSGANDMRVDIAYSVKTNPDRRFLQLAQQHGFLVEVISPGEVRWARTHGFAPTQMVYNGPLTPPALADGEAFLAVFADSLASFRKMIEGSGNTLTAGVRLRPVGARSRFGVDIEEPESFAGLVEAVQLLSDRQPFGISFHQQSNVCGVRRWGTMAASVVYFARSLAELSGRATDVLDVGGGWTPLDFAEFVESGLQPLVELVTRELPSVKQIILEPGKAFAEPCMAVVSRVVELRSTDSRAEAVIDGSLSELPVIHEFPHRMLILGRKGQVEELSRGEDRILGRLCMEDDTLARRVALPSWLHEDDLIVLCDAGAYDTSMAYSFGRGEPT